MDGKDAHVVVTRGTRQARVDDLLAQLPRVRRPARGTRRGSEPFEPGVETRNRKPLRQPAPLAAEWEIRFGPENRFRVLYEIHEDEREVHVLAIGEKEGNRLLIGGEEVGL